VLVEIDLTRLIVLVIEQSVDENSMVEIGYNLSSEEHSPLDLVCYARQAEEAGFSFASISDHYHPWIDAQGQSSFVWCTLGGISQVTSKMKITTGATCPTVRIHPAIIAQAAATVASMMPGRFTLALGSGENLNEHILGDRWPPATMRIDMLEEAVDVIRILWQGGMQDYHGYFYVVENARISFHNRCRQWGDRCRGRRKDRGRSNDGGSKQAGHRDLQRIGGQGQAHICRMYGLLG
jgi:hypothetical protein